MTRTCLYAVLGVERNADGTTLKAAYRRLALQLHPDKNSAEDRESAEERFKEAKEAYDILSDPHQRAWYDEHRAEFLRGREVGSSDHGDGPMGSARDLSAFFQPKCFEGFGSGHKSFFTVYAAVFKAIADDEDGSDDEDGAYGHDRAPSFGDSSTPYRPGVKDFYDHFMAFSTSRSFSWADRYNTAAAENRQIRRLMERENEKEREKERKKFSETVRKLCSHVRELDPRIQSHLAQVAAEQQLRRAEAERAKKAAEAERAARLKAYKEAEWARLQEDAEAGEGGGEGGGDDDDDEEILELYCPACRKSFRSERQFESHEQSKKHKDAVARLRKELLAEEGGDGGGEGGVGNDDAEGADPGSLERGAAREDGEVAREEDGKGPKATSSSSSKKPVKPVQEGQKRPLTKKEKKELAEAKARQARGDAEDEPTPADKVPAPAAPKPAKIKEKEREKRPTASAATAAAVPPQPARPNPGGRKKAADSDQDSDGALAPEPGEHECLVCGLCFPSRTKLFSHIEAKGHAQLKDVVLDRKDTTRGGSRGKKNK